MKNVDPRKIIGVKFLLCGPVACGKTCFLSVYKDDTFPSGYVPTIVEAFTIEKQIDNDFVKMHIWDTTGQDPNPVVRTSCYDDVDVFLLCIGVDGKYSKGEIYNFWLGELETCGPPDALIYFITLKVDLWDNNVRDAVSKEDVEELENLEIFKNSYRVSAKGKINVKKPFDDACRDAIAIKKERKREEFMKSWWYWRNWCCCFRGSN